MFKNPKKKSNQKKYDCVIVCGYPANDDGTVSKIMATRVEKAVELYQQGIIKYLILSGGAVRNEYKEAEVMANYAVDLGVMKDKIIIEDQAKSTYHNLMYASQIMQREHLKNAIVVTNSWHLRKADHYARKFNLDYVMKEASAPKSFNHLKVLFLHFYTNLTMYINLFKGYY